MKEIGKYSKFLLLKVVDRGFGTINRDWRYIIENSYNAFAVPHFHSVNSARLNVTVTVVFGRRKVSGI